jgi:hypothetical protein
MLIPDAKVEEAFLWLHDNVDAAAEARAQRLYLEEYRKTLKAKIMREHGDMPVAAQEREAYASKRYEEHLEGYKIAIFRDEKIRYLRETKLALIDAWRTASVNVRSNV